MREYIIRLKVRSKRNNSKAINFSFIDKSFFFRYDRIRTAWENRNLNIIIKEEIKDKKSWWELKLNIHQSQRNRMFTIILQESDWYDH